MQSAPDQEFIKITYSVKGVFTNRMKNELSPGKHVTVKLPYGNLFNQSHNKTNTVFIGGGTGITPFLSLFTHKSFDKYLNPKIYIGFRSSSYNIYKNELAALKSCYSQVFYENSNGPLDILKIFSENSISNDYFISGPPDMIRDFKTALNKNGVPENQIFSDSWD
jgi:NAD(P)H-flavin reductase